MLVLNTESYSKPTSLQSQEFRGGDIVEDNLYTMSIEEDNLWKVQLVFDDAILDEHQELETGGGKGFKNVMMETEHGPASLDAEISFLEDV